MLLAFLELSVDDEGDMAALVEGVRRLDGPEESSEIAKVRSRSVQPVDQEPFISESSRVDKLCEILLQVRRLIAGPRVDVAAGCVSTELSKPRPGFELVDDSRH